MVTYSRKFAKAPVIKQTMYNVVKVSGKMLSASGDEVHIAAGWNGFGQLNHLSQVQFDNTLVRLYDVQGRSERIKTTVFPVNSSLFLHATIYLFLITLSISLRRVGVSLRFPCCFSFQRHYFY